MDTLAVWLPAVAVVICAISWVIVEGVRSSLELQWCVCGHGLNVHDMSVAIQYDPAKQWGHCLKCICRSFHRKYA